jgi:hypothetical protein
MDLGREVTLCFHAESAGALIDLPLGGAVEVSTRRWRVHPHPHNCTEPTPTTAARTWAWIRARPRLLRVIGLDDWCWGLPLEQPQGSPGAAEPPRVANALCFLLTLWTSYWLLRAVAEQQEWTQRVLTLSSATHLQNQLALAAAGLLVFLLGNLQTTFCGISAVCIVCSTLVFGRVAEEPTMHGSFASRTPVLQGLMLAMGAVLAALLGVAVVSGARQRLATGRTQSMRHAVVLAALRLGGPLLAMGIVLVVIAHLDGTTTVDKGFAGFDREATAQAKGLPPPVAAAPVLPIGCAGLCSAAQCVWRGHVHHWQVGAALAIMFPFKSLLFRIATGVALGVMVHGISAYGVSPLLVPTCR